MCALPGRLSSDGVFRVSASSSSPEFRRPNHVGEAERADFTELIAFESLSSVPMKGTGVLILVDRHFNPLRSANLAIRRCST